MFVLLQSFVFTLLPVILAQTTTCPACDTLISLWDPDANTGSCVGNPNDPINYIVNFQQCLCSTQGQSDYSDCAKCNVNGDGGVPIDGLNFGPVAGFQSACSKLAADITSILKPSGLGAFANLVGSMTGPVSDDDILGNYILSDIIVSISVTGLVTDTAATSQTTSPVARTLATATDSATTSSAQSAGSTVGNSSPGTHSSDSRANIVGMKSVFGMLILTISGVLF
jgi:hypothetical protein